MYSSIASHFSATRYKPWPLVTNFLASLPPGSIGVDVGCGNGKYLHLRNILHPPRQDDVPRDCMTVGVDRSAELTELAQDMTLEKMASNTASSSAHGNGEAPSSSQLRANEVAVGDGLSSGFRSHAFDYAISIATIHHFSTRQRRKEAIQELIRLVKPVEGNGKEDSGNTTAAADGRGRFLVYVWALEQRGQERRKFDEDEDGGGGADGKAGAAHGRDVLVPWVLRNAPKTKQQRHGEQTKGDVTGNDCKKEEKVFQRCECRSRGCPICRAEANASLNALSCAQTTISLRRRNWSRWSARRWKIFPSRYVVRRQCRS